MEDAVVCGGGAAGLAAATWLGRYRRRTLVLDAGRQRNRFTGHAHGYLGLDGVSPQDLLDAARRDLARYDTVETRASAIDDARREGDSFVVSVAGEEIPTRRVLLATGVEDEFPDVEHFEEFYGKTIFHCSCCDGYEASDMTVAAIGWSPHAAGFALDLLDWGARVVLLTDGRTFEGDDGSRSALARHDVEMIEEPVAAVVGNGDEMQGLRLADGRLVGCERAFFSIAHKPRNDLARRLGCELDEQGYVNVGEHGETSVTGVYAAGDVTPGEQLLQTASAEGAVAGIACAMSLRGEYTGPAAPHPGPDPESEIEATS
ncbi:MAG: NAD(P)/FAD-dependent oxidoreductase [Actinomycetota bacterium]|nr:NAD(P)/FAD-dependent oxidoreductase [Actinomycetota bacterium]